MKRKTKKEKERKKKGKFLDAYLFARDLHFVCLSFSFRFSVVSINYLQPI